MQTDGASHEKNRQQPENAQAAKQQAGAAPSQAAARTLGSISFQSQPNVVKSSNILPSDPKRARTGSRPFRMFYSVASFVSRLFPMLDANLEAAGKDQSAIDYTARSIMAFVACFVFLALLSGFVIQARFTSGADSQLRVAAFFLSMAFACSIFIYMMLVPRWMAGKRMALINQDLLFATRHLMIQTSAGVPLYDAIVSISGDSDDSQMSYDKASREYGEVGKEFSRIVIQVRSGKELTLALEDSAAASPSEDYRKVVWQLANANRTGTRIGLVLHETVDFLAAEQLISIRSYGAQLSTLALFYMLCCIIAPTMGIVVLAIGANILPNLPVNESTFILILAMLTMVQAFFVGIIKSRRPMVSL